MDERQEELMQEALTLIKRMTENARQITEALGLPQEDMYIVMAALYRDRLPQHLLDEVNELAEMEQEDM